MDKIDIKMKDCKLAIIHGHDDLKNNLLVGNLEYVGFDLDELHSECLLNYASEHYSDVEFFKRLNYRHKPEVIGFFFLKNFGDIIFFNTTKNIEKYGYTGFFLLPDDISDEQMITLFEFAREIKNYSVGLFSSLRLEEGLLMSEDIYSVENETPEELLDRYFKNERINSKRTK